MSNPKYFSILFYCFVVHLLVCDFFVGCQRNEVHSGVDFEEVDYVVLGYDYWM